MLEKLRKDSLQARKDKNTVKANLLTTLLSEALMIGKNDGNREPTEEEITAVIKKFLKSLNEAIESLEKSGRDVTKEKQEKEILESFLPRQLSEEELDKIIQELAAALPEKSPKFMGQVMSNLKEKYPNQFDGKLASQLVKKHLS
ncbi:MAG: GatB/YqeY domain-containing protein [Spirochaetia bacterium]|nr:GatB/YqeY domain-containing protein [Spirochaetia bacterium]